MRGTASAIALAAALLALSAQPAVAGTPRPLWQRTIVAQPLESGVTGKARGRSEALLARRLLRLPARIDATRGKVRLTLATPDGPELETADLSEGEFVVTQDDATQAAPARTRARLVGGGIEKCVPPWSARPAVFKEGRRKLKIRKSGRVVTDDRYSITAGEGTEWVVTEECSYTRVDVTEGRVSSTPKEGEIQTLEDVLLPGDMLTYACQGDVKTRRCFAVLVARRVFDGRMRDFISILAAGRTNEAQLVLCVTPPRYRPAQCGGLDSTGSYQGFRVWYLGCLALQGTWTYRIRWATFASAPFGPVLPADVLNPEPPAPEEPDRAVNCQLVAFGDG